MTEQEKEIWLNIFMGRLLQDESREMASLTAWSAIEECRKAGITTGPVNAK